MAPSLTATTSRSAGGSGPSTPDEIGIEPAGGTGDVASPYHGRYPVPCGSQRQPERHPGAAGADEDHHHGARR